MHNIDTLIFTALAEVDVLIRAAFEEVGGIAVPGSVLDQNGLRDGRAIVREYVDIGEPGLALEHLIYMIKEPNLPISHRAYACIEDAGNAMGMDEHLWKAIRPTAHPSDE